MIMPPRVAPTQVMIIPFIKDEATAGPIIEKAQEVAKRLKAAGIRAKVDASEKRTPDKMWDAIKKGVPIRAEIGQRELEAGQITFIRRDIGKDSKATVTYDQFVAQVPSVLDEIHTNLYKRSFDLSRSRVKQVSSVADIKNFFTSDEVGFAHAPIALLDDPAYAEVKKENGLSSRCLPFEDEGQKVLIGKSY
jgi:prolyl-tRNA synthetase